MITLLILLYTLYAAEEMGKKRTSIGTVSSSNNIILQIVALLCFAIKKRRSIQS